MYLNAGGVTVSYYEWLKDLSHVRFGRMQKRFDEQSKQAMLSELQKLTGGTVSDEVAWKITQGPGEADLVRSGLEETMVMAYNEIRGIKERYDNKMDLRSAAFISALDKIAIGYEQRGIFP